MDFGLSFLLKMLLLSAGVGIVFVGHKFFHWKDDNVAEQIVEKEIKNEIGLDVDLSPDSPEPRQGFKEGIEIKLGDMIIKNEMIKPID